MDKTHAHAGATVGHLEGGAVGAVIVADETEAGSVEGDGRVLVPRSGG